MWPSGGYPRGDGLANLFRLVLLCIPLFGAVAATAEVQRIDRGNAFEVSASVTNAEPEMVLALNTVVPILNASSHSDAVVDQLVVTSEVVSGASAGLPICLALVFLVTLVRQRA